MLMNYRSPTAALALGRTLAVIASRTSLAVGQFHRAIKHRRALAVLCERDDRMLADIGLTRSDLRDALRQPLWRDPTAVLANRPAPTLERRTPCPRHAYLQS